MRGPWRSRGRDASAPSIGIGGRASLRQRSPAVTGRGTRRQVARILTVVRPAPLIPGLIAQLQARMQRSAAPVTARARRNLWTSPGGPRCAPSGAGFRPAGRSWR